jgi:hypothetical protein
VSFQIWIGHPGQGFYKKHTIHAQGARDHKETNLMLEARFECENFGISAGALPGSIEVHRLDVGHLRV